MPSPRASSSRRSRASSSSPASGRLAGRGRSPATGSRVIGVEVHLAGHAARSRPAGCRPAPAGARRARRCARASCSGDLAQHHRFGEGLGGHPQGGAPAIAARSRETRPAASQASGRLTAAPSARLDRAAAGRSRRPRRTGRPAAAADRRWLPCCTMRPSRRSTIRPPKKAASSRSWVTSTTVLRRLTNRAARSSCSSRRTSGSSAPSGSSSSSTSGIEHQRAHERHPLALAARQLQRVAIEGAPAENASCARSRRAGPRCAPPASAGGGPSG